ncbi:MAG TPA: DUF885 domain-containing protein [Candidatus Polarisedimenticolia bacterium]|nr:DUF885 domain-containing protein [Candidatus Polarisedimenticolia bacterium]
MDSADRLCSRILRTLWRHSPVNATYLGVHDYDSILASFDPATLDSQASELRDHLREIAAMCEARPGPSDDERLDLDLLSRELKTLVRTHEEVRAPFRNPGNYLEESAFGVYLLMLREFASAEDRAAAMVSRLREVPRLLEEARRNLSTPEEVPPIWAEMARDLGASTSLFMEEAVEWTRRVAPRRAGDVEAASRSAQEAVTSYLRFLEASVQPRARGNFSLGRDLFEFLLRESHGIQESVEVLERFGRAEAESTLLRLGEMAREGTGKPWQEQVESFQQDTPPPERLVIAYAEEIARCRQFTRDRELLDLPPGEFLEVVETPVFERKTTPFAAYVPPAPFEERQQGYFWVTPPDPSLSEEERAHHMKEHMLPSIPITCIHEGYPGHHVQLTLANRNASPVRRQIWTPVMVEGWALYCEEMMGEEGFYGDPRTSLLQLKDYLWRSCRVFIDVGLHTGSLTFEEAVRVLVDIVRINPQSATGEVKRYTKTPTQPLSYAVGKREIMRLREEVRRREGSAFSLKGFHHRLLQFGSIPPRLVAERILPSTQA